MRVREREKNIAANKALFNSVRSLSLPFGEYAFFGSSPMGVRGLKTCKDADVIVSSRVFEEFRVKPGWIVSQKEGGQECLSHGLIEIWKEWCPGVWDTDRLIREAEIIEGLPFVRLEEVLEWKKIRQHEKDISDIAAIEKFLGTWKLYLNSPDAWEAMLQGCRDARRTIDFESYIFIPDAVGARFLDIFKKKAKEGVRVRMLLDMVGSYGFYNSAAAKDIEMAGVGVRFFNPVQPWRIRIFFSFFHRDHRKILIVDSRVGYTGGVNIAAWMSAWRDTYVRVDGSSLWEMAYSFERMWAAARMKRILRRMRRPSVSHSDLSFVSSGPHLRQRLIYRGILKAIRRAKRYAYLTTPYFVPSVRFFSALQAAARRKVDVRILIPEQSDVRVVDIASGAYVTLALKSGVKIYHYKDRVLHVKSVIIDDEWGTVGSANLDNVSLLSNYEGNLMTSRKNLIEALKTSFLFDLTASNEVRYDTWIRRPFIQKFVEAILWPFHRIL